MRVCNDLQAALDKRGAERLADIIAMALTWKALESRDGTWAYLSGIGLGALEPHFVSKGPGSDVRCHVSMSGDDVAEFSIRGVTGSDVSGLQRVRIPRKSLVQNLERGAVQSSKE